MILPDSFADYTSHLMGEQLWAAFLNGMAQKPPVSIRLNPLKAKPESTVVVGQKGRVPWCEWGYYLSGRPTFTFDPLFHAGYYYVQEAASMFIGHVLRQYVNKPALMLDLCAAPGGKSTAARATLPEGSVLFCNEPKGLRAQVLAENMQKQGHADVVVTSNFARDYRHTPLKFDVILADVPCSGEGMFRKDAEAINEWSVQNVKNCQQLQREIVSDIWPCLKDGGIFIYSTCTFNAAEDEENVRFLINKLGAEPLSVATEKDWRIAGTLLSGETLPVYRFIPGVTQSEGLFMAVLRKTNSKGYDSERKAKKPSQKDRHKNGNTVEKNMSTLANQWLTHPDDFQFVARSTTIAAIPKHWIDLYEEATQHLNILHAGINVGEMKGRDLIPEQGLVLSPHCQKDAFPRYELTYTEAIRYLQRDALTLPTALPRGFVVVTFHNQPLGLVKHLGNRTNNLYPAAWRIKSTHIPTDYNEILSIR